MDIRYAATKDDVAALLRHQLRHSRRFWLLLLGFALFPASFRMLLDVAARYPTRLADLLPWIVAGVVTAVLVPAMAWLRTKPDERVLRIATDGIHTQVGRRSGYVPWHAVAAVVVAPEYVFITGRSGNGFSIPSRAFADAAERGAFVERLHELRGHASTRHAI